MDKQVLEDHTAASLGDWTCTLSAPAFCIFSSKMESRATGPTLLASKGYPLRMSQTEGGMSWWKAS